MKSKEVRQKFFDFFTKNKHTMVTSSSLIPAHDPTLLFANAGMNQFKDVFLGTEKRSYSRAVTIQKCVRAGGKHNDLDNVGFTKRHLTFFEMMGNFSFGDYFKEEAIPFAWDFLTKELKLDISKLYISVYETDDESVAIWRDKIGIAEDRIYRLGKEENFWQMGDLGPCGPCTEIFIDRGPEYGCKEPCGPACECDRFLELWNLVFMQYDQQPDGSQVPLKRTGVDTGMGLERISSVLQGKDSVFETDLFTPILAKIEELTGKKYEKQNDALKAAFRVLADHIRSSTMIISDGGSPSNEGRGYVLRKIIRRGALFAQKLTDKNIFPELARVVIKQYKDIYPEIQENEDLVVTILTSEVEKFSSNLVRGNQILNQYFKDSAKDKVIDGTQAFKLYDTYGFPVELVHASAREKGYTVDFDGFEKEMEKQKAQSGKKVSDDLDHVPFDDAITTEFTGYDELETASKIIALVVDAKSTNTVSKDTDCWVIAAKSPFFIVGGGQVPDNGWLVINDVKVPIKQVRYINGRIAARIKAPGAIAVGGTITSMVDEVLRTNAMKNHTATHLLQSALIAVCGQNVKQAGSVVHPDHLRFDFSYHQNLTAEQIKQVEDLVNAKIRENIAVAIDYTSYKEAVERGVLAFFGEKYNPEKVRVVDVPGFSMELCGGTHVDRTGDIGTFKIVDVSTIAAGYRRIVAVSGVGAINLFQDTFDTTKKLSQQFSITRDEIVSTIEKQTQDYKKLEKELKLCKRQLWTAQVDQLVSAQETINAVPFLYKAFDGVMGDELRELATMLQAKKAGLYFLISNHGNKSYFVVAADAKTAEHVDLKKFAAWLKAEHGLRGGGARNMLQGGGGAISVGLQDAIVGWLTS